MIRRTAASLWWREVALEFLERDFAVVVGIESVKADRSVRSLGLRAGGGCSQGKCAKKDFGFHGFTGLVWN